jgi:hypothetical protein
VNSELSPVQTPGGVPAVSVKARCPVEVDPSRVLIWNDRLSSSRSPGVGGALVGIERAENQPETTEEATGRFDDESP